MALEKAPITSALQEARSFILTKAVERVPVEGYLRLRYWWGRGVFNDEATQILMGAEVIKEAANKQGKKYDLNRETKFFADPTVTIARTLLKRVPLSVYLPTRVAVLESAIDSTRETIEYCREWGRFREEETAIDEEKERVSDLDLTNAVIAAANTSLKK